MRAPDGSVDRRIVQDARMPKPPDQFVAHCLELLKTVGSARSRRMFGGHGIYVDDLFVAIVAFDRLYLKTDEHTRARFERAGCEAFVYDKAGGTVSLRRWIRQR
jgi:DNA transformation protein and related proteins